MKIKTIMIKYEKNLLKIIILSILSVFLFSNIEAKTQKPKSSKSAKSYNKSFNKTKKKSKSGRKSRYRRLRRRNSNGPDLKKITSESASKAIYKDEAQNGVNDIEIDQKN